MRLLEYQAKRLLEKYGIAVPRGVFAQKFEDVVRAVDSMGFPVMLKAQVKLGGRGKAGGVVKVERQESLRGAFDAAMRPISGEKPIGVLVEMFVPRESEAYVSIALDRSQRRFVLILSREGGVEVERVRSKAVLPLEHEPVEVELARGTGIKAGLRRPYLEAISRTAHLLSRLAVKSEAELVEVNPLALVEGKVIALDAKIILDDNALFRHPEFMDYQTSEGLEAEAANQGFSFVQLEGDVIVVGNGAGLVMSSLDLVSDFGGKPAAFLDLGGGAGEDRVYAALKLASELSLGRVIFLNVFGGITRGSDVARGIRRLYDEGKLKKPVYARVSGSEEEEATQILEPTPVQLFQDPEEAAKAALNAAKAK